MSMDGTTMTPKHIDYRPSSEPLLAVRDKFREARKDLTKIAVEDADFEETFQQSLEVVRRALDTFGPESLAISFNGGKDACVVLYLLMMVLAERDEMHLLCRAGGKQREKPGIPVVYFQKDEFPELDEFKSNIAHTFGFEFRNYDMSYKEGTKDLVNTQGMKAIIMGQRRGDPYAEDMEFFTRSTPGWSEFTRVNPALEWRLKHVWRFLRGAKLPYCSLYDQGYTSLGERRDTAKNNALLMPNGEYLPAYQLAEEHLERSPRSAKYHARNSQAATGVLRKNAAEMSTDSGRLIPVRETQRHQETVTCEEKTTNMMCDIAGNGQGGDWSPSSDGDSGGRETDVVRLELDQSVAIGTGVRGKWNRAMGWMGGSMLPATVLVFVVLMSIGLRRDGVPPNGSGASRT